MHLLLLGISHRTAPVELRERLDFQTRGLEFALRALASREAASEAVIVSTCNRAEIYTACDDVAAARTAITKFVSEYHGIDPSIVMPHIYDRADLDAVRHLFRVAAGLDSLVVGEPQILGQVKEAHTAAGAAHTAGALLNRLFHASFGVGKRVRTETGLGSGAVSVSFAAVSLAKKIFGDLRGLNVLVVGAGEMGKLTALHMKSQGVHQVTIVSRTMAHAARTAEAIGGAAAAPMEDLDALLGEVRACRLCEAELPLGPRPVLRARFSSRKPSPRLTSACRPQPVRSPQGRPQWVLRLRARMPPHPQPARRVQSLRGSRSCKP